VVTSTLAGERILLTGVTGQIAFPIGRSLAEHNEVWGVARFSDPRALDQVEAAGIRPVACDLASGDFSGIPGDVSVVLHLAAYMQPGTDYNEALRHNAESTGLLLQHCRAARAALVMSTHSVYRPKGNPAHVYHEDDALGDVNMPGVPTYSVSKIGQEAVARFCARAFDLPVTIARMNAAYGPSGGLLAHHADSVAAGKPIVTRADPCWYSPIHEKDIVAQLASLVEAASTPATVVNWSGDEAVSVQQWAAYMAELLGVEASVIVEHMPGTLSGSIADTARRRALTGDCSVGWREGVRDMVAARAASTR